MIVKLGAPNLPPLSMSCLEKNPFWTALNLETLIQGKSEKWILRKDLGNLQEIIYGTAQFLWNCTLIVLLVAIHRSCKYLVKARDRGTVVKFRAAIKNKTISFPVVLVSLSLTLVMSLLVLKFLLLVWAANSLMGTKFLICALFIVDSIKSEANVITHLHRPPYLLFCYIYLGGFFILL